MHPIFVDLTADLQDLEKEVELLERARERYTRIPHDELDEIERWTYVTALAAGVEKTYSGIEKMLVRIAREIDRHVPDGRDWHVTLLRRMAMAVPERRPAVLSEPTVLLLNQLRGFRHRARNSYSDALDLGIVLENAGKTVSALAGLREDLESFRQRLDKPVAD